MTPYNNLIVDKICIQIFIEAVENIRDRNIKIRGSATENASGE